MLELNNICYEVPEGDQSHEILRDVSLIVPRGRLVVITGPNGGGKSTLARLIMGIVKPTAGTIRFQGRDITALSITERAKLGISFAFQQPVRFKGLQVLDLLRMASGRDITPSDACEYLSAVGLCARDYINREVNASLSGGELKRIEIATVLARGTALSLFDEPEAGIDLWSFRNLIEVFQGMRANIRDGSVVIISHQERILSIADEIVVLRDGQLATQGPRAEILPQLTGTASALPGCQRIGGDRA